METLYTILEVDRSATEEEIKVAYYRKSTQHHPDRGGDADVMSSINRAAMVLLDPQRRAAYDDELKLLAELCPTCDGAGRKWKQQGFNARKPVICKTCNGAGVLRWKNKPPSENSIALGGTINKPKKGRGKK